MGAELLHLDFEGLEAPEKLAEVMSTPESAGNRWNILPDRGTGGTAALIAPVGQITAAVSKRTVPGFDSHPVITLRIDTILSARWNGASPFMLPFSVGLVASPDEVGEPVAGFHVDYEGATFGEETEYNVGVRGEGRFVWHPASVLEELTPNSRDSSVASWFRWTAVFTHDAKAGTIATVLSVQAIGQDGTASPEPIQKWELDPIKLKDRVMPPQLHVAVHGRAREGFGIHGVDNLRIEAGAPGANRP